MGKATVEVSSSKDAAFFFRVNDVDFELRLYTVDDGMEIFDAGKARAFPSDFEVRPDRWYYVRYNNNDGGRGVLDIELLERVGESSKRRYAVKLGQIQDPSVIELEFILQRSPDVSPP